MLLQYTPTEDELEAVELSNILHRKRNDLTTQEGLVASLVHDIINFKYDGMESGNPAVREKTYERNQNIVERLALVADEELRQNLSACYSPEKCMDAIKLVSWGKHFRKVSKYTFLRWDGFPHEDACRLAGLYRQIGLISELAKQLGVCNRVIYANKMYVANTLLQEGVYWDYGARIYSAAINDELYKLISSLAQKYIDKEIGYIDFKVLFPTRTDSILIMSDEGMVIEVIKVRNFLFMVID